MVFATITSPAIPFCRDAVGTETIAPEGFDPGDPLTAFRSLRFDAAGRAITESIFNSPAFASAAILVAGSDFGVGEHPEEAARALAAAGFAAIAAVSYAPAFATCAAQAGIVLILTERERIIDLANEAALGASMTLDLITHFITTCHGERYAMEIHEETRMRFAQEDSSGGGRSPFSSPHILFAKRA